MPTAAESGASSNKTERPAMAHPLTTPFDSPPRATRARQPAKSLPKLFALARSRVRAERDDSAHAHVGGRIHRLVRAPRRGCAGMAQPPNAHACSVPHARNRATTHAKPAPARRLKDRRAPEPAPAAARVTPHSARVGKKRCRPALVMQIAERPVRLPRVRAQSSIPRGRRAGDPVCGRRGPRGRIATTAWRSACARARQLTP